MQRLNVNSLVSWSMRKEILIVVLGLLLSSCESTSNISGKSIDQNENYIILTTDAWSEFKGTTSSERIMLRKIASNHCAKYNKFAFNYSYNYEEDGLGKKSLIPRCKEVPIIIPLPKKKHYVSIYQLQKNI